MIDKASENWEKQQWWFKFLFFGIRSRKMQLLFELASFAAGILLLLFYPFKPVAIVFFITAYLLGWSVRYGDNEGAW